MRTTLPATLPGASLAVSFVGLVGLVGSLAGCPAAGEEVHPPDDQLFFPTGVALAPDESVLFVLDANSDLRYDTGAVSIVDLARVEALATAWTDGGEVGDDCGDDAWSPTVLRCDERTALVPDGAVRIGNFATEVAVQELAEAGKLRLFAAVRGDPSLTWIDYDVANRALSCTDGSGRFPECDDAHRLTRLHDDPDLFSLPTEPFDVYVDSAAGYVVTTHLCDSAISVADAPPDGGKPVLSDAIGGLFAPSQALLQIGASCPSRSASVAGRHPGAPDDQLYVTSATEARVQNLTIARPDGGLPVAVSSGYFFMTGVRPSDDSRGIVFSSDGDRAYVLNRDPPMLQILDTSLDATGVPRNALFAAVELCQQSSNLAVGDFGAGERIYVACFRAGQVWVVDPEIAAVETIIDVGRGPHGVAVSPAHGQVYVTNFVEDTIAVIDARPGVPTENRLVLRLGRPRQEGSD